MAGLYETWEQVTASFNNEQQRIAFYNDYFATEQEAYAQLLEEAQDKTRHEGSIRDLAEHFGLEPVAFSAFIDGINTSLKEEIPLENLTEDTNVVLDVDLDMLYRNMLDAGAKALAKLPQWDALRTPEQRAAIRREWLAGRQAVSQKAAGRNDPCPCGSGKKYKKCCWAKDHAS